MHLGGVAAVHRREGGPLRTGCPLGLDVIGEHLQIGGRAHDDTHRHVDVEDLAQQVGERQRGQRISAQVVEVRLGRQIGGRRAQQSASGPADGLQHRPVGTAVAQRAQLVGLAFGQLGVELFQTIAVALLELWARQLADTGEQTVLERERRCLDDEVARDLIGLQAGRLRDILQRLADERLERRDIAAAARQCIRGGHDDRQQVGAGAVAVDVDLPDQRAVAEHRLQLRDGHELALRELQHVVAAVEIRELIGTDLGHDVAGAVVAVRVEHLGGDLRPFVVAGEQVVRFDEQLASGVWLVGVEVAQIGDVGQLVVDHRWASHLAVDVDDPGLGRAVAFHQV